MGAPGIEHYVQFINGRFSIFAKNSGGGSISSVSSLQFWNSAGVTFGNGDGRSDPRVFFDPFVNRWFASEIDVVNGSTSFPNHFLLAVSNTADPTQGFKGFKFDAASNFGDFDTMGVNADALYLSTNNFPLNNPDVPENTTIVSIPLADLLSPTPTIANRTQRTSESLNNEGNVVQPAIHVGPSSGHEVLLGLGNATTPTTIQRTNVFNAAQQTPNAATLSASVSTTIPPAPLPPRAQQPGGTLDSVDHRLAQVFQVGNTLWTANCINIGGRAGIQWYKIDEPSSALLQTGQIADANFDFIAPSIAANANGDVVIGYTRSSSSSFASAYASVGTTSGGVTSFGAPTLLKAGVATYTGGRWGDYSATYADPTDPGIFWTTQEWATTGGNNWATQVAEIVINAPGEVRWKTAANGDITNGGSWFTGAIPSASSHVIFSRPVAPGGAPYTVALSVDASATNDRLSIRQGNIIFNLEGNTWFQNNADPSTPSVTIAEFDDRPTVSFTVGTLASKNASIAAGRLSIATVSLSGATWNNSASMFVGGSSTAPGGTASLTIGNNSVLRVGGELRIYNAGTVSWNSGTVSVGGALNVIDGHFIESPNGARLLKVGSVATSAGGIVDLNDNDMIASSTAYPAIATQIASARNNGAWNGPGITSSAAAANPTHNTTLGVLTGAEFHSAQGAAAQFDNSPVSETDVLVKYTWYGDTDFNGKVNFDDYVRTDNGFNNHLTGWFNGDFDLNNVVNFDDYVLIDLAFNTQSGTLRRALSFLDGTDSSARQMDAPPLDLVEQHLWQFGDAYAAGFLAAVPEPATVVAPLYLLAVIVAPRRHRRRRWPE
jgi:hypothetical protein